MKSITIHGLEDELDQRIRLKADEKGLSLNKTIKLLVRSALGMGDQKPDRRLVFQDLFGSWSREELEAFNRATEDLNRIDPKDWPLQRFEPAAGQVAGAIGLVIAGLGVTLAIARFGDES